MWSFLHIVRWLTNLHRLIQLSQYIQREIMQLYTLSILIVCGPEKKFIKIEVKLCENALSLCFSSALRELP